MSHASGKCNRQSPPAFRADRRVAGFTLIELMVSLVLGLVVIAGVVSVFFASQQSYRTNEALGDVQDSSRIAFELMSRDIRQAGLTGCNNNGRVANVLNDQTVAANWWANWANALHGYTGTTTVDPAVSIGTAATERVSGTDSLEVVGADDSGLTVKNHVSSSATIHLNETTSDIAQGDIVMVCDPDHTAIMQVSGPVGSHMVTFDHNTGAGVLSPGNCSKGLGYPPDCTGAAIGNKYEFPPNSSVAKLTASDWYIGNNDVSGRSLYRKALVLTGGKPTPTAQEMVRGVTDMKIGYHVAGGAAFVLASAISDWAVVDAVQVTLTLESSDKRAGTDTKPVSRTFTSITTVRNRVK